MTQYDVESMNFLEGMKNSEDIEASNPSLKATNSFNISWLGSAGATNSASVETVFNGGQLGVEVVVTGTPTWGLACVITVTPTNCQLASGASSVSINILGANLGTTFVADITPSSSYAGTTVKYGVSINGASGAVLYATGDIG